MSETLPNATQNAWLHPLASAPVPSLSDRLVRALEAHVAAEAQDLEDCQQVANDSSDAVVRLLMGMIVEDEKRHHSLLQLMINRLHEEMDFVASPSALPVPSEAQVDDSALIGVLRTLIRDEHEGARHLRHLARQDSTLYGGLYALLLETVARDSEKHATILRFLLRRSEAAA
jgi:hypothetical protein